MELKEKNPEDIEIKGKDIPKIMYAPEKILNNPISNAFSELGSDYTVFIKVGFKSSGKTTEEIGISRNINEIRHEHVLNSVIKILNDNGYKNINVSDLKTINNSHFNANPITYSSEGFKCEDANVNDFIYKLEILTENLNNKTNNEQKIKNINEILKKEYKNITVAYDSNEGFISRNIELENKALRLIKEKTERQKSSAKTDINTPELKYELRSKNTECTKSFFIKNKDIQEYLDNNKNNDLKKDICFISGDADLIKKAEEKCEEYISGFEDDPFFEGTVSEEDLRKIADNVVQDVIRTKEDKRIQEYKENTKNHIEIVNSVLEELRKENSRLIISYDPDNDTINARDYEAEKEAEELYKYLEINEECIFKDIREKVIFNALKNKFKTELDNISIQLEDDFNNKILLNYDPESGFKNINTENEKAVNEANQILENLENILERRRDELNSDNSYFIVNNSYKKQLMHRPKEIGVWRNPVGSIKKLFKKVFSGYSTDIGESLIFRKDDSPAMIDEIGGEILLGSEAGRKEARKLIQLITQKYKDGELKKLKFIHVIDGIRLNPHNSQEAINNYIKDIERTISITKDLTGKDEYEYDLSKNLINNLNKCDVLLQSIIVPYPDKCELIIPEESEDLSDYIDVILGVYETGILNPDETISSNYTTIPDNKRDGRLINPEAFLSAVYKCYTDSFYSALKNNPIFRRFNLVLKKSTNFPLVTIEGLLNKIGLNFENKNLKDIIKSSWNEANKDPELFIKKLNDNIAIQGLEEYLNNERDNLWFIPKDYAESLKRLVNTLEDKRKVHNYLEDKITKVLPKLRSPKLVGELKLFEEEIHHELLNNKNEEIKKIINKQENKTQPDLEELLSKNDYLGIRNSVEILKKEKKITNTEHKDALRIIRMIEWMGGKYIDLHLNNLKKDESLVHDALKKGYFRTYDILNHCFDKISIIKDRDNSESSRLKTLSFLMNPEKHVYDLIEKDKRKKNQKYGDPKLINEINELKIIKNAQEFINEINNISADPIRIIEKINNNNLGFIDEEEVLIDDLGYELQKKLDEKYSELPKPHVFRPVRSRSGTSGILITDRNNYKTNIVKEIDPDPKSEDVYKDLYEIINIWNNFALNYEDIIDDPNYEGLQSQLMQDFGRTILLQPILSSENLRKVFQNTPVISSFAADSTSTIIYHNKSFWAKSLINENTDKGIKDCKIISLPDKSKLFLKKGLGEIRRLYENGEMIIEQIIIEPKAYNNQKLFKQLITTN